MVRGGCTRDLLSVLERNDTWHVLCTVCEWRIKVWCGFCGMHVCMLQFICCVSTDMVNKRGVYSFGLVCIQLHCVSWFVWRMTGLHGF